MPTCPSCGTENPEGFNFCGNCATQLEATPVREERKFITALFCDLVGSTALGERLDAEDVSRLLRNYQAICRKRIESHGGIVEKFIGDAVVGVFGVPLAHEDDPERAVRAAFRITEDVSASDLKIEVRIGVNTGEALVRLDVDPRSGEGFATGDTMNTAARLEAAAPVMGVAVGAATHRASSGAIVYEELPPISAKGKANLVEAWRALHPVARIGTEERDRTPFVGRDLELEVLIQLFERSRSRPSTEFVTIVAEPGLGKSRLVRELARHVDHLPELVTWREGRCLPYGDGISFWALGEIVKAQSGILETDDQVTVSGKLDRTLSEPDPHNRAWIKDRLAPLVGLETTTEPPQHEEAFTAWRRFLEQIAAAGPTVLVIEDLHWADEAFVTFLEQLSERTAGLPLLVVVTARPEVEERHPSWPPGRRSTVLSLSPLTDAELKTLIQETLPEADPQLVKVVLERAGGSPLYAEQVAAMLREHPLPIAGGALDETLIPPSVQALIAARIDALPPEPKRVLMEASVVGKTFWAGAIASLEEHHNLEATLAELVRREFCRPVSPSTMEGDTEFSFWHALVRDVAYAELTRAERARMHAATARWIEPESTAGDRLEDRAELLAHHTTEALSLARAADLPEDLSALEDDARRFLLLAGERQTPLDAAKAATYFRRALELTSAGRPERPRVLRRAGELGWRSGQLDVDGAVRTYEEAVELALAAGDRQEAAIGMRRLYFQLGFRGDGDAARANIDRGIELLEGDEPTPVLAELYACRAEDEMFSGHSASSLRWADHALSLPHNDAVAIMTLHIRGNGRCELGDLNGLEDLEEALRRAEATGDGLHLAQSYSYLSEWVGVTEGCGRGLELNQASIDVCDRRGIQGQGMWARAESLWLLYDAGRWDVLLARTAETLPWAQEHGDTIAGSVSLSYRTRVLAHRGEESGVNELLERALPVARQIGDLQVQAPAFVAAAVGEQARGNAADALGYVKEFDDATKDGPTEYRELQSPEMLRICLSNGEVELATRILGDRPVFVTRAKDAILTGRALLTEERGDVEGALQLFREAATAWESYGDPFERAHALEGAKRCLFARGRTDEAEAAQSAARRLFASLGMP